MNIDNIIGQLHVLRQRQNPDFVFVAMPAEKAKPLNINDHRYGMGGPTRPDMTIQIKRDRGVKLMVTTDVTLTDGEVVHHLMTAERKFVERTSVGPQQMTTDYNVWTADRTPTVINWSAEILLTALTSADQGKENFQTQPQRPVSASVYYNERSRPAPTTTAVGRIDDDEMPEFAASADLFPNAPQHAEKTTKAHINSPFDGAALVSDHTDPVVDEVQRCCALFRSLPERVEIFDAPTVPRPDYHTLNIVIHDGTDTMTTARLLLEEEHRYYRKLLAEFDNEDADATIEHTPIVWLRSRVRNRPYATWLAYFDVPTSEVQEPALPDALMLQQHCINKMTIGTVSILDKVPSLQMRLTTLRVVVALESSTALVAPWPDELTQAERDWHDTHPGTAHSPMRWYATVQDQEVVWVANFYYDIETDDANRDVHVNYAFAQKMADLGRAGVERLPPGSRHHKIDEEVTWISPTAPVEIVAQELAKSVAHRLSLAGATAYADFRWQLAAIDSSWTAAIYYTKDEELT